MPRIVFFFLIAFLVNPVVEASEYYATSLNCKGTMQGAHEDIDPSNNFIYISVTSFHSVRSKDCRLSPSSEAYIGFADSVSDIDLKDQNNPESVEDSAYWYGPPLYFFSESKTLVVYALETLDSATLKLKLDKRGKTYDFFSGTWRLGLSTAKPYSYRLTCVAKKDSSQNLQIINSTEHCTQYPKKEYLDERLRGAHP